MTQAGTMLGTPSYMSPEQFRGEVVDARTDVYSAGVVLYQLLTGERPFEGGLTAIMHKVLTTEPPVPSELSGTSPPSLDAVVKRAMAKRPDDRFASASAFAEALRAALAAPVAAAAPVDDSEATLVGATLARPAPAAPRPAAPPPLARTGPTAALPAAVGARTAGGSRLPVFIGAGVVAVLALGTGGWFVFGPSGNAPVPPAPGQQVPGQQVGGQTGGQPAGGQPVGGQPLGGQPVGGQPLGGQPASGQQAPVQPTPGQQAAGQPTGGQPVGGQPVGGRPLGGPPLGGPPMGGQPANGQQAPVQPTPGQQAAGQPALGQRTTGQQAGVQPAAPGTGTAPATPTPSATAAPSPPAPPALPSPAAPAAVPVASGPTVAPPTAPAPVQEATTDLHALRQRIAQALVQAPCALANGLVQDSGAVSINGYAGSGAADALRQQLAGVVGVAPLDWNVRPVDQVFCSALGTLRPIAVQAGAPLSGLSVTLAGGRTALHDGERIMPRVTMGDFSGELRVDYLGHDGSVVHLYPTAADPAQHIEARPSVRLAPGAQLSIGEGGPGRPIWEVGPPYGTDMIIAVASSVPVLTRPPVQNAADDAAPYLRDLANGIARVRQAGGRVAGTLLLLDTLAK